MIVENGKHMSEKQLLKEALDLIADACCLLFETEEPESQAAAFMTDSVLKYLQVIYRDDDVLLASADYTAYEQKVYERRQEIKEKEKQKEKQKKNKRKTK